MDDVRDLLIQCAGFARVIALSGSKEAEELEAKIGEALKADTFGSRLRQMREELASIVDRMNRDRSYEAASKAQTALVCVTDLDDEIAGIFGEDQDWSWQPNEEK